MAPKPELHTTWHLVEKLADFQTDFVFYSSFYFQIMSQYLTPSKHLVFDG
jgi:hypothetical protein